MSSPPDPHFFSRHPVFLTVILHYQTEANTRRLLDQLLSGGLPGTHLLVVDNGSPNGSGEALERDYAGVLHLSSPANLGFSGGMNLGLEYARDHGFQAVALLNNDLKISPEALGEMAAVLDQESEVGLVGAVIYRTSFTEVPVHAGHTLDFWTGLTGLLPLPEEGEIQDCDWVSGAVLMARMAAVVEAGPLDEEFFLYWEEVELAQRWKRAGWRTVVSSRARALHHDASEVTQAGLPRFLLWRNRWLLVRRAFPWYRQPVTLGLILVFGLRDVLGLARHGRWDELWIPVLGNLYGLMGWFGRDGVEMARRRDSHLSGDQPARSGSA